MTETLIAAWVANQWDYLVVFYDMGLEKNYCECALILFLLRNNGASHGMAVGSLSVWSTLNWSWGHLNN